MAQYFSIHPTHPQQRLLARAAVIVRDGGVIAYPTDSGYALGCHLGDRTALDSLRRIRDLDERHHLTLMCRNLAELSQLAVVDNSGFRLLKLATPGSYTFILRATREVPRRLLHPKRRTIGVRISPHPVALALLDALGEPLLSTTLQLPGDGSPLGDPVEIRERLERDLDLVVDGGACATDPTTVIDLTEDRPRVLRLGRGRLDEIGLTSDVP